MPWKPDYSSVDDLASYQHIDDAADDPTLALSNTTAARAIDRHTHRQFGQVAAPELRLYSATWNRRRCRWIVEIDDLQDITGLTVTVTVNALPVVVTYTLEPVNAADEGRPYERLIIDPTVSVGKPLGVDGEISATGKWGWTAIPKPVQQANLLQGSRFHMRRQAPFGIAGSPDQGSEMRLLARLDPDVETSLCDFVRDPGVGAGMNLADVMDEVAAKLDTIPGLRTFAYPPSTVTPPAGIVTYPSTYTYDETFGRGMDRIPDLPVVVLVGKVSDRASRDQIAAYADGSGPKSIKEAVETGEGDSFDTLRVTGVAFDIVTIGGVDYLAATFTIDIAGKGA